MPILRSAFIYPLPTTKETSQSPKECVNTKLLSTVSAIIKKSLQKFAATPHKIEKERECRVKAGQNVPKTNPVDHSYFCRLSMGSVSDARTDLSSLSRRLAARTLMRSQFVGLWSRWNMKETGTTAAGLLEDFGNVGVEGGLLSVAHLARSSR